MINEVVLEGIVVREPWKFMDDLFFRLVIYRDSDLPAKKLDLERDAGDYINVRGDVFADLSILFPSVVPKVLVTQTGIAKLRAFTH